MDSHLAFMQAQLAACLKDVPTQRPSDWCVENLSFDEASNHGPFSLSGCEYVREVLDDWARTDISDEVLVWGSQTRKTGTLMGGLLWAVENDPCGVLWVMPSIALARVFSKQRLKPMIEASTTARLIPVGSRRFNFATCAMQLGASTINLVGSNSASNLASQPCRRVVSDEVDKFDESGRGNEGAALGLAEQRTKAQVNPQRWKSSSPSVFQGPIWQSFLLGDQRRYFMPCPHPHCQKEVTFVWSESMTVLTKTGTEAYISWSREAKAKDGTWDYEMVRRTAHAGCPHCKGEIRTEHKTKMIREGVWRATNPAAPTHFVSRHLSSLYSTAPECSFGAMAVKFLMAHASLEGLQGFINGDLAEPWMDQQPRSRRTELILPSTTTNKTDWVRLMTVDCQAKSPNFWFVVRAWGPGMCEGVEAGSLDTWEEVRETQLRLEVKDSAVFIDSGYGAYSGPEVPNNCARFCKFEDYGDGKRYAIGWTPVKGMPSNKRWTDPHTKIKRPWYFSPTDPFLGSSKQGQVRLDVLEFAGEFFKDILAALRLGKGGFRWIVNETMATDEYWRQMDAESKRPMVQRKTGRVVTTWQKRSSHQANHLLDCEVNQLVSASTLDLFDWSVPAPTESGAE
jgi:Phage terminase large subunit (GpA)